VPLEVLLATPEANPSGVVISLNGDFHSIQLLANVKEQTVEVFFDLAGLPVGSHTARFEIFKDSEVIQTTEVAFFG